jgi:hypothetical protein
MKKMHHALQGGEIEMGREVRKTVRKKFMRYLEQHLDLFDEL